MALRMLQCSNRLRHINLGVSVTLWKKLNIFEIFGVQQVNRGWTKYGSYSALRHSTRRSRFPLCQARSKAYTREIDESINDTHLQQDLKTRPLAQARKAQVCSSLPSICQFRMYICVLTKSFSLLLNAGC